MKNIVMLLNLWLLSTVSIAQLNLNSYGVVGIGSPQPPPPPPPQPHPQQQIQSLPSTLSQIGVATKKCEPSVTTASGTFVPLNKGM